MKHFSIAEFDSPDAPGSGRRMDHRFLEMIDQARDMHGLPFRITSGYRTDRHNLEVGGVPNSSHRKGNAADISINGWRECDVVRLIAILTLVGFRRIGRANSFVHADNDPDKPQAYWDYFDGNEHKA